MSRTPYLQALEFSTISAIETLVKFVSKKGQNPYQKKHLAMLTTPADVLLDRLSACLYFLKLSR